jgi:hypothetical protein
VADLARYMSSSEAIVVRQVRICGPIEQKRHAFHVAVLASYDEWGISLFISHTQIRIDRVV